MTTTLNGWDVEAMTQAITMVKEQPEAGLLTWRGRSIWDGGFGLDVRTREIEQLGEVMDRHFTLRSDHPRSCSAITRAQQPSRRCWRHWVRA